MSEAEHTIVAGILQKNQRMAEVQDIRLEFFGQKLPRALFSYAGSFYRKRGRKNALDLALARSKLETSASKMSHGLLGLIGEYESYQPITDSEFREALNELAKTHAQAAIREHGTAALEAMLEGDYEGAEEKMRAGLIAVEDADLEDDRPTDIRGAEEIEIEKDLVDSPEEEANGSFDIGFPRLTNAVSFRRQELTILGGYAADGKGFVHGTLIPTPQGWTTIEEIVVGQEVIGSDGKPTKVLGVYRRGRLPLYRVGFSDRVSVLVDPEHLWAVKSDNDVAKRHHREEWRSLSTEEIARSVESGGRSQWRVPLLTGPVRFAVPQNLRVEPYLLGVLLGDGSVGDSSVAFTSGHEDDRVAREVEKVLPAGVVLNRYEKSTGIRWTITGERNCKNAVLKGLRFLRVMGRRSWEKSIPESYLLASPEDRLALLQGLIDTDGYVSPGGRPNCVFTSCSKKLSDGVADIVRSLGGIARQRVKETTHRPSHEVCLTMPGGVVPTRAKVLDYTFRQSRSMARKIVSVERAGEGEVTCLAVEAQDKLFVTSHYLVTHNTQLSKALVYNANCNDGARVLYVALEMSKREMRTLFVAQHAATLDPRGVDYAAILNGNAKRENGHDYKLYMKALDDFQIDGHEDQEELKTKRGSLYVWAPRKRIDMSRFIARARAMKQDVGLDIVVADYLELIQPSKDFGQYRLNVKEMCEVSKATARELNVWTILNHQISRKGRDDAEKRKPRHYLMRDLGESSGVERAADHILWAYSDDDLKVDREVKIGIAKARKGKTIIRGFHAYANFAKALVAPLADDNMSDEE